MKKYVMNKNVLHDGKAIAKGEELPKSHPGFEALVEAGHANEMKFEDEGAEMEAPVVEGAEMEAPVVEGDEEAPKKHRRR